jgi:uncharacterized membrane protein
MMMAIRLRLALFLALLMLITPLTPLTFLESVQASPEENGTASPLEILSLAAGSLSEPAIVGDDDGNFHIFWIANQTDAMYSVVDSNGDISVIQPLPYIGSNIKWSPRMEIDDSGNLHLIWIKDTTSNDCLVYLAMDPSSDSDPTDGVFNPSDYSMNNVVCKTNFIIENIANPNLAVDSQGAAHIVWQDKDDPLDLRFGLPGIRYSMMVANWTTHTPNSPIFDTLLTPLPSKSTFPEVAITSDDEVVITWQDSRGSMIELVVLLDSSGGMASEWEDICTLMYGGSDGEGWTSPGLQNIADIAGVTLLDTIYGLGDYIRPQANSGNCAGHNTNDRSRSTTLTPQVDSGGIRKIHRTMYDGQSQNWGNQQEEWGPGTTWACLSWMDAQGNTGNSANPPTQYDHRWNPNASKIVIPIGDEGPKVGDPAQQSDDVQSIDESHDACVNGGIVPWVFIGDIQSSASNNMWDHGLDLAHCPVSGVSVTPRSCSGANTSNIDAAGGVGQWPPSGQDLSELFDQWMGILNSGSPEVWTTVVDPYAKLSDLNHVSGTPAHYTAGGVYTEDLGWGGSNGNNFVVVNDTQVTYDDSWSSRPAVEIASNGWLQFIWSDSRTGHTTSDSHELVWQKVDLSAWDFNGQAGGINLQGALNQPQILSPIDGTGAVGSRDVSAHSGQAAFVIDEDDLMHTVWVESDSGSATNISYRRSVDATRQNGQGLPNPWWVGCSDSDQASTCPGPTYEIAGWPSEKMGTGGQPVIFDVEEDFGSPPGIAVTSDNRRTAGVVWVDSEACGTGDTGPPQGDYLCFRRIQRSLLQLDSALPSLEVSLEPGESVTFNFTVEHLGTASGIPMDVNFDWEGLPSTWTVTALIGSGPTATVLSPINSDWQIASGDSVGVSLTIEAPSKIDATISESHSPLLSITSDDDEHGSSVELGIDLLVIHGLVLSAQQQTIEIEQGGSGVLSVNISNYGNLVEEVSFPSTTSEIGRSIWGLPYGWQVSFVDHINMLADGTTNSKTLQISVPESQEPGQVNITIIGSSDKVSNPVTVPGAQAAYEMMVTVARKRAGNIVFELWDSVEEVGPGECGSFSVDVTKHFGNDDVIITVEDGPVDRPESISEEIWREEHWLLNIDYSGLPGGNTVAPDARRYFTDGMTRTMGVELCAPSQALAGEMEMVKLRGELFVDSAAGDEISMQVSVLPMESLSAEWLNAPARIEPGQAFEVSIYVVNDGNVPQTFDPRMVESLSDWTIEWVSGTATGLQVGDELVMVAIVHVPVDALAGDTEVLIELHSVVDHSSFRAEVVGQIEILPRIDLRLLLADDSDDTHYDLRPRDEIDISFIVENSGNIAETPWIENHSTGSGGSLSVNPRMDGLEGIDWTWYVVENAGTPLALFTEINTQEDGRLNLPLLNPGENVPVVLRLSMADYPGWDSDYFGIRVRSPSGYANQGGDIDADEQWLTTDSNEQIINLNAFAPDLYILSVSEKMDDDEVELTIQIQNSGNDAAVNILLRVCGINMQVAESSGCDHNDAVAELRITFIDSAQQNKPKSHVVTVNLKEPIGTIVVSIDADNEVIESDESNNMQEREMLLQAGSEAGADSILDIASSNLLLALMGTLWIVITLLGVSAFRSRRRDRRNTRSNWRDEGDWSSELDTQKKKSKKGTSKASAETAYAEVHSMDMSLTPQSSVDVSDLDLAPSDPTPDSAPSGALEPLGDIGYDPSEEKAKSDEFTIGDLIDGLL